MKLVMQEDEDGNYAIVGPTGNWFTNEEAEEVLHRVECYEDLVKACEGMIECIGPGEYFPAAGKTRTDAMRAVIVKAKKE